MCAAVSDSFERRRIALVIGNNKYKQSPLYNCVNDANDLSKALKSIGFLVTSKTDLNCEEMDKEIENFLESIHQGDLVLFFFSGHGVQRDEQNYLIPCDNDRILGPSDFKYRAINAQRFLDLMSDKNPFVIVYLLDCCRTDMLPNMTRGKASYASSTGLAAMSAKAGTLIAFACAPGTVAADTAKNGRNGMFTYHLLQNITRPEEEITLLLIDVANGVANDTNERQIPYTTSALRQRGIHLATRQKKATQPINYQEPSYSIGSASAVPKSTTTPFKALPKPGRAPKAVPQEFAAPGTCDKLYCEGRPCAKCHKCRDWQFTGNHDKWNWVRNWENWKDEDWNRWRGGDYKLFIKRDGATCGDDLLLYYGYDDNGCLCADNIKDC